MKAGCTFQFCGRTWTIRMVPKIDDGKTCGRAMTRDSLIEIDSTQDYEDIRDTILHELIEAAYVLHGCEYSTDYPSHRTVYILDHTQHHNITSNVRGAYDQILIGLADRPRKRKTKQ